VANGFANLYAFIHRWGAMVSIGFVLACSFTKIHRLQHSAGACVLAVSLLPALIFRVPPTLASLAFPRRILRLTLVPPPPFGNSSGEIAIASLFIRDCSDLNRG